MKKVLSFFIITLFVLGFSNVLVKANEYLPKSDNYFQDEILEYYSDEENYVKVNDFIRIEMNSAYTILSGIYEIELGEVTFYEYDKTKTLIGQVRTSPYAPNRTCLYTSNNAKYIMGKFIYYGETELSPGEVFYMYKGEGEISNVDELETENLGFKQQFVNAGSNITGEYYTSVDNPTTPEIIRSAIKANDNYDGNISENIIVTEDTYTENMNKVGSYRIKYEVSDSSNNTAHFLLHVIVKDLVAPVITGRSNYIYEPTDNITINDILDQLNVSDNYYELTKDDLELNTDTFTGNENKLGTYQLEYSIEDGSGNVGAKTITIEIKDTIAPTITGVSTLSIGVDETLTEEEIISQFVANDSFEGDVNSSLEIVSSEYFGNENEIGEYEVKLLAQDSSGNKSYHTLTISVTDTIPPIFFVTDMIVNIQTNQNLSDNLLITTVARRYKVDSYKEAEVVLNEYDESFGNEGRYRVVVKLDDEEYELYINAIENLYSDVTNNTINEKTTFYGRLLDALKKMLEYIKNLFD